MCSQNQWFYQTALTAESGRLLVGYILKQMEAFLRQTVGYKYKLTAGMGMLHPATARWLEEAGVALEQSIRDAVTEFYREATKTVVTVDRKVLERIRQEALETQEKLSVPEEGESPVAPFSAAPEVTCKSPEGKLWQDMAHKQQEQWQVQEATLLPSDAASEESDPWKELKEVLTQTEREALALSLSGEKDIRQFADAHGVMLEVLADGINEKAFDLVGDSLLDDGFAIYEDYVEQVREILN